MPAVTLRTRYTIAPVMLDSGQTRAPHVVETGRTRARIVVGGGVVVSPPTNTVAPVASGVVRIGELLSTTDGTWTGTPTPTYAYQWTRDGVDIGGATSSTYTVVAADISAQITCEVTATGPGGTSAPEASNALASPWRPILLARPGVLIWDGQDPYCYGGAGVGSPVASIYTVDGVLLGTQALAARQPTRLTAQLSFDGVDDHIIMDAHAPKLILAHTLMAGFDDVRTTGTSTITAFSAGQTNSGGSAHRWHLDYAGVVGAARQRFFISDAGSTTTAANVDLSTSYGVTPYNFACRSGAGGGNVTVHDITPTTPTQIGTTKTRPSSGVPTYVWFTIGAYRVGSVPSVSAYWLGKVRYFAVDDNSWSDGDLSTFRTCALAAGVM